MIVVQFKLYLFQDSAINENHQKGSILTALLVVFELFG